MLMATLMAKKLETSKKLVYISDTLAICLSTAVICGTFLTEKDISPLSQVTVAAITECGVANAFYYWKAKNENRYKYVIKLIREWAEKYGIDAVIRIADIVLKE